MFGLYLHAINGDGSKANPLIWITGKNKGQRKRVGNAYLVGRDGKLIGDANAMLEK